MKSVYFFHMTKNHYVLSREADICELETKRLAETGEITEGYEKGLVDGIVYYTHPQSTFDEPPKPSNGLYPYRINGKWVLCEDKRTAEEIEVCEA